MKTYKYEKMLNKINCKIPKIKRHKIKASGLFTEYKDTFASFAMAFVLLVVLVFTSIPPSVIVKADNSRLSTDATINVIIKEIKP